MLRGRPVVKGIRDITLSFGVDILNLFEFCVEGDPKVHVYLNVVTLRNIPTVTTKFRRVQTISIKTRLILGVNLLFLYCICF
jgi:hypothetical protein